MVPPAEDVYLIDGFIAIHDEITGVLRGKAPFYFPKRL